MRNAINICLAGLIIIGFSLSASGQNAREIIKKADDKMQGNSNKSEMSMTIVRPTYERTIEFKNWSLGRDYFMTLITAPAKDKGQVFMKYKNEMWNYMPSINRMIKLPPSMMSQGWMGSDYTNDDLVNQSSIVTDYNQTLKGKETIDGYECFKIEMIPTETANVVWGKVMVWVDTELYIMRKTMYYDDEDYLVRTELAKDVKTYDDRQLPSTIEIIPADEPEHKTIIKIISWEFNVDIKQSFFTQQNMKRLR